MENFPQINLENIFAWCIEHWEWIVATLIAVVAFVRVEISIRKIQEQRLKLEDLINTITTVFGLYQYLEFVKSFYRRSSRRIISVQRIWHIDSKLREAITKFAAAETAASNGKVIFCGPVDLEKNIAGLFWRLHFVYCSGEISNPERFEFLYDKTFDETHDNTGKLRFTIADDNLLLASSLKREQEVYGMPYKDEKALADFYVDVFDTKIKNNTVPVHKKLVELLKARHSGPIMSEVLVDSLAVEFKKNYLDKNIHDERHDEPPTEDEFKQSVRGYLLYLATVTGSGIIYDEATEKFTI